MFVNYLCNICRKIKLTSLSLSAEQGSRIGLKRVSRMRVRTLKDHKDRTVKDE